MFCQVGRFAGLSGALCCTEPRLSSDKAPEISVCAASHLSPVGHPNPAPTVGYLSLVFNLVQCRRPKSCPASLLIPCGPSHSPQICGLLLPADFRHIAGLGLRGIQRYAVPRAMKLPTTFDLEHFHKGLFGGIFRLSTVLASTNFGANRRACGAA